MPTVRSRVQFLRQLHDREALLPHERQRRFVESEGWISWPAPALADALKQFIAQNRMLSGGLVIDGRTLSLADVDVPVLCFVGEHDKIGQPQAVRAIGRAAPRAAVYEVSQPVGHLGIVVGSAATTGTWPTVAAWASNLDNGTDMPASVRPMAVASPKSMGDKGNPVIAAVGQGIATSRRLGAATLDASWALMAGAATTVPRLLRLELVRPETRVSLGRLLDERADGHPEEIGFPWKDRAYSHAALKGRIDNVVSGLLSIGVRQGEPVGILMDTRPSMLVAVSALNRIGAVVVLLRPGGSLGQEIALGGVGRIVTDPQHVAAVHAHTDGEIFVLGGAPLPGSPEVCIARIDESTRQLALRADGSAERCHSREIGMLVSRVEAGMSQTSRPQRGLFSPGDAWLVTGDLFFRDEDGDFWLAGSADSNVTTAHGVVGGSAVEDALGLLDSIDLNVTYAVPVPAGTDLAVTALTLRSGRLLHAADLSVALGQLSPDRRPHVVHVVDSIPTSTSHRPLTDQLVEAGRPAPGNGVYELDPRTGDYQETSLDAQRSRR